MTWYYCLLIVVVIALAIGLPVYFFVIKKKKNKGNVEEPVINTDVPVEEQDEHVEPPKLDIEFPRIEDDLNINLDEVTLTKEELLELREVAINKKYALEEANKELEEIMKSLEKDGKPEHKALAEVLMHTCETRISNLDKIVTDVIRDLNYLEEFDKLMKIDHSFPNMEERIDLETATRKEIVKYTSELAAYVTKAESVLQRIKNELDPSILGDKHKEYVQKYERIIMLNSNSVDMLREAAKQAKEAEEQERKIKEAEKEEQKRLEYLGKLKQLEDRVPNMPKRKNTVDMSLEEIENMLDLFNTYIGAVEAIETEVIELQHLTNGSIAEVNDLKQKIGENISNGYAIAEYYKAAIEQAKAK